MLVLNKNNDPPTLSGKCTWKESVRMSNYQRLMLLTLRIRLVHLKGHGTEQKTEEKNSRETWSEKWKPPTIQYFPRDIQLWLRMVKGFFVCLFCCCFKLQAWQHTVQLSLFLLPVREKVRGVTKSTGENNIPCFFGALWAHVAKKKQAMWLTLHRKCVKGGTSGKSRKRQRKKVLLTAVCNVEVKKKTNAHNSFQMKKNRIFELNLMTFIFFKRFGILEYKHNVILQNRHTDTTVTKRQSCSKMIEIHVHKLIKYLKYSRLNIHIRYTLI